MTQGDASPNDLDNAEWPRARKEPIDARQDAAQGESEDESSLTPFEGVTSPS
jgi:hypothetical protein